MPKAPTAKPKAKPTKKASKSKPKAPKSKKQESNGKPATPSKGAKKSKAKPKDKPREILYPKFESRVCIGEEAITADQAKELLGWQEESENIKFGGDYLLTDLKGKKVRCNHNVTNRPLYSAVYLTLMQEHLRRRWQFNGEPIIIGKTGLILNGQHTLISIILAAQKYNEKQGQYSEWWKTEPTMEKQINLGISEDDATVNTMDTCKPRSLADVIYRSAYFADTTAKERRLLARICDYSIRMLWDRTGASDNAFAPRRTHSESLDFMTRHPKVLDCVKHIYEENDGNKSNLSRYLSPGYCSALLYLMGSSTTEREMNGKGYSEVNDPSEAQLDWDNWDAACEYFVYIAAGAKEMDAIREALGKALEDHDEDQGGLSIRERCAILIKGFNQYVKSEPITAKDLELLYEPDEEGFDILAECPITGGIDLGASTK